ncbi:MAG TPA: ROK family glucokinase [Phycisphaerae bacterium]|jgi:glucokinase|nr:ROK family glucokinase [Phycisphaerae bacterium]HOB73795.1 ROK family glucokinase [Phycisphaerae bacterium]HOJ56221.1 ROK family glucokinase [Phycisphaerae bacterium]HOL27131.1 ROK family glucokinase [Phycisphaerae bacterium]HPP21263.1 ROK family glucokinase [Phycisphaerae bacterium]
MGKGYCVGVDLGGTNIKAGLLDDQARILCSFSVPTEVDKGNEVVVNNIVGAAERAIREAGVPRDEVVGIGIGSPGPLSHRQGMIINPGNLPSLKNTPIRRIMTERTGIRCTLENDANAAAWGEYWAGAGKGVTDLVMFTLGTGVGGGAIVNGRLIRGYFENGAELGHIIVNPGGRRCSCGQLGCVEAYSSAYFLARHAEDLIKAGQPSVLKQRMDAGQMLMAEHIVEAAKAGDEVANKVWHDACYYLAVATVTMQHVTNPERVVMAGGLIAAGDFLLEPIRRHFRELTWELLDDFPDIRFATLGNDAGFIGAAGCAWAAHETGDW